MGTWGAGVYDNDTAADYLLKIVEKLVNDITLQIRFQIRINAGFSESDILICNIDLLTLLIEHKGMYAYLPETKEIKRWKTIYMDIWESTVDYIGPTKTYREERNTVLNQTFDNLISLAEKRDMEKKGKQ